MKSKIIAYLVILITCLSFTALPSGIKAAPQQGGQYGDEPYQDYQDEGGFYEALEPHGEWMNYGNYGEVWRPNVGRDFRPYYTNGHWVNSEYGWTWVSNYSWGWAPFHYGRWLFDDGYGWIWVPGDEWGPAWVSWRSSPDYYGWAPLGPGMSIGANISFGIPASQWAFLPCRYMGDPYMNRYYAPYGRNTYIYNQTNYINNVYVHNNNRYYRGPDVREVERVTNRRVQTVRVANMSRPGNSRVSRSELAIYRPPQATLRRELTNNERSSRVIRGNDRTNNPTNNTNTPGRTTRRVVPTDNNRNDNNNRTLPAPSRTTPESNRPGRVIDRNNDNRATPPPTRTPETDRPKRVFDRNDDERTAPQPNRPTPERPSRIERTPPRQPESRPAPQPRIERSQPQPQPRTEPRPQPRQESPRPQPQQQQQPRIQRQAAPAPAPRPAPSPAPQQRNNDGGSSGGGRVKRG